VAQGHAYSGEELADAEWFCQIVIRAIFFAGLNAMVLPVRVMEAA